MIKVLLADDIAIIRKSVKLLIDGNEDIQIIGECNNGQEVLNFITQIETDVILMDITMPKINGIEATKLISKLFPKIKVISHSSHDSDEHIKKMYDAGAVDHIPKKQCKEDLIRAIHKAFHSN